MPIGDPPHGFFHPILILMIDSYIPITFQLSALGNTTYVGLFPDLRWSQTAKYGYAPNPTLQNVFMAVAMDLPDFQSPWGA